ncbi:MAG TPA: hypothetical protein VKB09_02755 [Thermomicrobiales bacterium]|nr:hypothetical protein [Thermomicrobiales bacterium]
MVALPAAACLISLACALAIARDAVRRPRPDKLAWVVAFAVFTIAAGTEVVASFTEWTATLARVYYLTGAVLIVGYLALGELYLLAGPRIARFAPGVALLVTAISATIVFNASVDRARLAGDGWEAIERGTALKVLAISLNAGGTLVVVGGALYSAWHFRRLGIQRHRMIGCALIALGTLVAASGGTLTRLGHDEYLYIGIAAGVAIIFAGYLETRRPDPALSAHVTPPAVPNGRDKVVTLSVPRTNGHHREAGDPVIAFLESQFLPLDDAALAEACRVWSAPRHDVDAFTRGEAHRIWALRLRLSPEGQSAFDAHTNPAKLQLAELYHDVLIDVGSPYPSVFR